jgi:Toprim domain
MKPPPARGRGSAGLLGEDRNSPPIAALGPNSQLDLAAIDHMTGGGFGVFDVPCPMCGPSRTSPAKQRKKVLSLWRDEPGFARFHCVRCREHGFCRDGSSRPIDLKKFEAARSEARQREQESAVERLAKAQWLWGRSKPPEGTPTEVYLRNRRGFAGSIPGTIRHLPARGDYGTAVIAAFGLVDEPEPGCIIMPKALLRGVHLTRLLPDGSDKAGTEADKKMVGRSTGWPIIVAPPNDLLGLAITEGIEDALSVYVATGLGAWAAGSASRMPALAETIPAYVECVTIYAHDDDAGQGQRGALDLAQQLHGRGLEVFIEGLRS